MVGSIQFLVSLLVICVDLTNTKFNTSSDNTHKISKRQATDGFRTRALELHNDYRARHGSPPLIFDDNLNEGAEMYAIQESRSNVQKHSCGPCELYGENLAYRASTGMSQFPRDVAAADWAVSDWYQQNSNYNYTHPDLMKLGGGGGGGEFAAMISKSSRKFGIGISYGAKISSRGNQMRTVYIVARYFPPGNVLDVEELKRNVQPPRY